jgi:hypothetical protein
MLCMYSVMYLLVVMKKIVCKFPLATGLITCYVLVLILLLVTENGLRSHPSLVAAPSSSVDPYLSLPRCGISRVFSLSILSTDWPRLSRTYLQAWPFIWGGRHKICFLISRGTFPQYDATKSGHFLCVGHIVTVRDWEVKCL